MAPAYDIDILESTLRKKGELLDVLLIDHTTKKQIIWGTDSYISLGKEFAPKNYIKPELITGMYGKLIQPRAVKSREEQTQRTKNKAEVFTPLRIVDVMNKQIDWAGKTYPPTSKNWQEYVAELKLEITCGEAPYIVSRYNPTANTRKIIQIDNRVGFLDRKLHEVSRYCHKPKEWLKWAKVAYQSSYGYEWQGDNLLIARENLLYTLIDYYKNMFGRRPSLKIQQEFADIISWNIFQMDGIKCVIPMSCRHKTTIVPGELTLFGATPDVVKKDECEGCKFGRVDMHNGRKVKIMDWKTGKSQYFYKLLI